MLLWVIRMVAMVGQRDSVDALLGAKAKRCILPHHDTAYTVCIRLPVPPMFLPHQFTSHSLVLRHFPAESPAYYFAFDVL